MDDRRVPARLVAAVIVIGTVLRVTIAATIGLGVDESYAVVVARTPSWSYFDHPGLSFWIPGLLARAAGSENAVLLRAPFILMFAATTWVVYRLGARLFGDWAGAYAALLLNIAPVFTVAFGGWVLLDGVAAAFAALSKYQAIFLPIGLALFVVTYRDARRALTGPGPPAALCIAALGVVPTLLWNAAHGWASFAFQFGRGASPGGNGLTALLENVGGQALYLSPWLWVPLIVALVHGLRRGPADGARWLLCCMATPPILLFTLITLGGNRGLPHWSMVGYLMLFPLLGDAVARRLAQRDRVARRWLVGSVSAFGVVLALAWSQ